MWVGMGLTRRWRVLVSVQMMIVVLMAVRVLDGFMGMRMGVKFGCVQPDAKCHKSGGDCQAQCCGLAAEQANCCADKWGN
jgi:hypothetical protein